MKEIEWIKIDYNYYILDFIVYNGLMIRCYKNDLGTTVIYDIGLVSNGTQISNLLELKIERDMFDGRSTDEMRSNDKIFWEDMLKPLIEKIKRSLLEIEKTFGEEE